MMNQAGDLHSLSYHGTHIPWTGWRKFLFFFKKKHRGSIFKLSFCLVTSQATNIEVQRVFIDRTET